MPIFVRTESIGTKLHRMLMYNGEEYVGEYERSQEANIKRKKAEIAEATDVLLALFQNHSELCVRWDGNARKKSIRAGGIDGEVLSFCFENASQYPSLSSTLLAGVQPYSSVIMQSSQWTPSSAHRCFQFVNTSHFS